MNPVPRVRDPHPKQRPRLASALLRSAKEQALTGRRVDLGGRKDELEGAVVKIAGKKILLVPISAEVSLASGKLHGAAHP